MSEESRSRRRKTRTREHVIADLGVNYVERQIILAGFAVERVFHDYGLDLWATTFDQHGEVENDQIGIQVKSTDNIPLLSGSSECTVRIETADLQNWMYESDLVVLALYAAKADRAYWLNVQEYTLTADFDEEAVKQTLRIPMANRLDVTAVRLWRDLKEARRLRTRPQQDNS